MSSLIRNERYHSIDFVAPTHDDNNSSKYQAHVLLLETFTQSRFTACCNLSKIRIVIANNKSYKY